MYLPNVAFTKTAPFVTFLVDLKPPDNILVFRTIAAG
jgi:hypothetical protein